MADKYTSTHTGQQIDNAVDLTNSATQGNVVNFNRLNTHNTYINELKGRATALETSVGEINEAIGSIDGQIEALEDRLAEQTASGLLPRFSVALSQSGYRISTNGSIVASTGDWVTEKIAISSGYDKVLCNTKAFNSLVIAFYTADDSFISGVTGYSNDYIQPYTGDIPLNARYVAFMFHGSDTEKFSAFVYSSTSIQDRLDDVWLSVSVGGVRTLGVENALMHYFISVGGVSTGGALPPISGYRDGWMCAVTRVFRGDTCEVSVLGGSNGRAWSLWDNDKKLLSKSASGLDCRTTKAVVSVTQDGYIVINHNTNSGANDPDDGVLLKITPAYASSAGGGSATEYGWGGLLPSVYVEGSALSTTNAYTSSAGASYATWAWRVEAGATYKLSLFTGYGCGYRTWVVYNTTDRSQWVAANAVADSEDTTNGKTNMYINQEITIPAGGEVLVFCGYISTSNRRLGEPTTAHPTTNFSYRAANAVLRKRVPLGSAHIKSLRILSVGNSFTCDEMSYLPYVLKQIAPDVEVEMGILWAGACSIQQWAENTDSGTTSYPNSYSTWDIVANQWTPIQSSVSLKTAVGSKDWDIITFQQYSRSAHDYSTIGEYLSSLVSWLKTTMNSRAKVGWLLTHSYHDSSSYFQNGYTDGAEMFAGVAEASRRVMESGYVDFILPTGTAVQNARTTVLKTIGAVGDMCNDGSSHLQEGIGCLCAAMAAAGAIMSLIPNASFAEYDSRWCVPSPNPVESQPSYIDSDIGGLGWSADKQAIACKCAVDAITNTYKITQQ